MMSAENTVIILGAELGAMSLAFKNAGFHVIAAYESDKNAAEIYEYNFGEKPILSDWSQLNAEIMPDSDIVAGRLVNRFSKCLRTQSEKGRDRSPYEVFREVVSYKRPKIFFVELNSRSLKKSDFQDFFSDMYEMGYKIYENDCDTQELTGLPVKERKTYVVGITNSFERKFELLRAAGSEVYSVKDICKNEDNVDEKNYKVNYSRIKETSDEDTFFCWKNTQYVETESIRWNHMGAPLVRINGRIRKITLNEIARLKGYPDTFDFDRIHNTREIYVKLIYGSNVIVLQQFTKSLSALLNSNYYKKQQVERGQKFESLVKRYFVNKKYIINDQDIKKDYSEDFLIEYKEKKIYIETKYDTSNVGIETKIK